MFLYKKKTNIVRFLLLCIYLVYFSFSFSVLVVDRAIHSVNLKTKQTKSNKVVQKQFPRNPHTNTSKSCILLVHVCPNKTLCASNLRALPLLLNLLSNRPLLTNEPYRETCAHQGKQRAEAASHEHFPKNLNNIPANANYHSQTQIHFQTTKYVQTNARARTREWREKEWARIIRGKRETKAIKCQWLIK